MKNDALAEKTALAAEYAEKLANFETQRAALEAQLQGEAVELEAKRVSLAEQEIVLKKEREDNQKNFAAQMKRIRRQKESVNVIELQNRVDKAESGAKLGDALKYRKRIKSTVDLKRAQRIARCAEGMKALKLIHHDNPGVEIGLLDVIHKHRRTILPVRNIIY